MTCKIVVDSSSDLLSMEGVDFSCVPLHILVDGRDYRDDENLDLSAFKAALAVSVNSASACPAPDAWEKAFGDGDRIFCITMTSGLSGTFNSALVAKNMYEEKYPGKKVYLIDSLSTGPKLVLLCRRLRDLIQAGEDPDVIYQKILLYNEECHICFSLASLNNFAKNGRVSPLLAKGMKALGIRVVGIADRDGKLQMIDKARGDKSAASAMVRYMKKCGYQGGSVVIAHNGNHDGALMLKKKLMKQFGTKQGSIITHRGICSYYAEEGSFMVGFDRD